jgi:hypothetical protein
MMDISPEDKALVDVQNEEARAAYEKEQERLAYMWYEIFKTPVGQAGLADLRERCNVNNSCMRGDAAHPDPYAVMFQEGKRAVYNHIISYIRHYNERIRRQN